MTTRSSRCTAASPGVHRRRQGPVPDGGRRYRGQGGAFRSPPTCRSAGRSPSSASGGRTRTQYRTQASRLSCAGTTERKTVKAPTWQLERGVRLPTAASPQARAAAPGWWATTRSPGPATWSGSPTSPGTSTAAEADAISPPLQRGRAWSTSGRPPGPASGPPLLPGLPTPHRRRGGRMLTTQAR